MEEVNGIDLGCFDYFYINGRVFSSISPVRTKGYLSGVGFGTGRGK